MSTIKFSLFDFDRPEELKAFEDAMMRAFLRALRVARKEGLVEGYTPPPPEDIPERLDDQAVDRAFGALIEGGNARPLNGNHFDIVGDPSPARRRRKWEDSCKQVFQLPEGFIPYERAQALVGGTYAQTLLRDWVHGGELQAVIVVGSKFSPSWGTPGQLMMHEQQLISLNANRRRRAHPDRITHLGA